LIIQTAVSHQNEHVTVLSDHS